MSFLRNRIRLALAIAAPVGDGSSAPQLFDVITGATPRLTRARAVQFELALFNNGVLDPLTGLTSITLEVKPVTAAGVIDTAAAAVMSKTVSAASFNAALTQDIWDNDSGATPYHAVVTFLDTETGLTMTGHTNNELAFGIVITGVTSIGNVTLGGGVITVVHDGGTPGAASTPPVAAYTFTDEVILAMIAAKLNAGTNAAGQGFILTSALGISMRIYVRDEADGSVSLAAEQIT